jgi:ribonuclease-3
VRVGAGGQRGEGRDDAGRRDPVDGAGRVLDAGEALHERGGEPATVGGVAGEAPDRADLVDGGEHGAAAGGHVTARRVVREGEEGTGGRDKASILADTLEALIGAVYLDLKLEAATDLVHRLFDGLIDRSANLGAGLDWKTSLQELTADEGLGVPEYHVAESGPDHQKTFMASVKVGPRTYGAGEGRSKKEAEQKAAESAWTEIREQVLAAQEPDA